MARQLGFSLSNQTRLATAISELARNVIQYAGKGVCILTNVSKNNIVKIRVIVEDQGPGIPDIQKAMEYGYSTSKGLGAGLPSTKRIVHEFHIDSKPGHTRITIGITQRKL